MTGPDPAAAEVLALLRRRGQTLATAESLTGGMIGALVTGVPGSSAAYLGGLVTYATRLKGDLAGVPAAVLERRGPVAGETAEAMARGTAARCGADWGLAVTGVAGPEPQDGHPVGQVFVAVAGRDQDRVVVRELRLDGNRAAIRAQTAEAALRLLAEVLGTTGPAAGVLPRDGG